MIRPGTLIVDRIGTLVLGLAFIAGAVLGYWWYSEDSPLPYPTDTSSLIEVLDQPWWPWVSLACGILLIAVGLRWLAAHLPRPKAKRMYLPGSDATGKLTANVGAVAAAAAQALTNDLGVRSAKGHAWRERGTPVMILNAVIEPDADLVLTAQHADRVSAELAQVLGRNDIQCRISLRLARRGSQSRVT